MGYNVSNCILSTILAVIIVILILSSPSIVFEKFVFSIFVGFVIAFSCIKLFIQRTGSSNPLNRADLKTSLSFILWLSLVFCLITPLYLADGTGLIWTKSYISKFLETMSSIGTYMAAMFAVSVIVGMEKQQKTMENQLESAYLPQLRINPVNFSICTIGDLELFTNHKQYSPIPISKIPKIWVVGELPFQQHNFPLFINNIGLKSATNVEIKIKTNVSELKNKINILNNELGNPLSIGYVTEEQVNHLEWINNNVMRDNPNIQLLLKEYTSKKLEYVAPIETKISLNLPTIPQDYMALIATLFHLTAIKELKNIGELVNKEFKCPISINMEITYKSISNKNYGMNADVKFDRMILIGEKVSESQICYQIAGETSINTTYSNL
ncbi:hypothetical protein HNP92_001778 [Methanococcus maripaludis]|uniref:Uncharacterized protein n=1 Tax=Methanococcus maripaludis TaxID=39152 RepID=A0A7J9S8U1_METMI|nr:hypothetical protein [Methanococcus maripaludis]MBB6402456.1 hypothetical protein [Methanococcus maripaludis]